MKNICILLILTLICCHSIGDEHIPCPDKTYIPKKNANFLVAMKYLGKHEGFWSNHPRDYGQATYMGISKRINPNWPGWATINQHLRHNSIKWNDSIPSELLTWQVHAFYLDIWVKEGFDQIEDQDIANYVLNHRINSTSQGYLIKKTLLEMGYPLILDTRIDSTTVYYLNKAPKWELLCKLMNNRIDFYTGITERNPSQLVFLGGWVKRIKVE